MTDEPLAPPSDDLDPLDPSDPEPLRILPALLSPVAAFLLLICLQIAAMVAGLLVLLAQGVPAEKLMSRVTDLAQQPWMGLVLLAVAQLGFGLTALLGGWLSPVRLKERLGWLPMRGPWTLYVTSVVGIWFPLAISLGLAAGLARLMPGQQAHAPPAPTLTAGWYAALVALVTLGPGFCEELLFRGYMQTRLLQRWRPWVAILVTTVLFALVHLAPARILVAFPLGLWFGIVAWRTGSIWPAIAAHAFVNGTLNLYLMLVHFNKTPESTQNVVESAAVTVGLICFVIACVQLGKLSPPVTSTADAVPPVPVEMSDPLPEPSGE